MIKIKMYFKFNLCFHDIYIVENFSNNTWNICQFCNTVHVILIFFFELL